MDSVRAFEALGASSNLAGGDSNKTNLSFMIKKILFITFFVLLAAPLMSTAARSNCPTTGLVPCGTGPAGECPCQLCDFFVMAGKIVNFLLFTIVPPLAVLMVVIGGAFFILGSGYDPSLVSKGKAILSSVAIGLLLVYGSWVIVNLFFVAIGLAQTDLGNAISQWFVFPCP